MMNNGLQRLVESLVDSINLTEDVYHSSVKSTPGDKWINKVITESWAVILKQDRTAALECLIKIIVDKNNANLNVLFKILSILIEEDIYSCKDVACTLVNSEPLKVSNKHYFRLCYSYINTLLPSLDYKANREVFNKSIEKTHTFPEEASLEDRRSLYFCLKVIRRLLSRRNNLMPAYFAMHELMKCFYPEDSEKQPHKLLQGEITSFMASFKKPAKLLIPYCRPLFCPVVGLTHASNNNFRLDAGSLVYTNVPKGAIVYSESISKPQVEEVTGLLMQTKSTDLASFLYDIYRGNVSKSAGLEGAFSQMVYEFMVHVEAADDSLDLHWVMGTVEHLVCSALHFLHLQAIGFSEIFNRLNEKTMNKSWTRCRKYIWWFVINATSGFINKNTMEDFVPCLKFFDILYPMTDRTWVEEISASLSIFSLPPSTPRSLLATPDGPRPSPGTGLLAHLLETGPLVLWMHLIRKSKSLPTNLPRNLPAALQPMFEVVNQEARRLSGPDCASALASMGWPELVTVLNIFSTNNETTAVIARVIEFLWGVRCQPASSSATPVANGDHPPVLLPAEVVFSMSVHVRLLVTHLLMVALFSEAPQSGPGPSPQAVESFCRLILHREMDVHGLAKFVDGHFLQRGLALLTPQPAPAPLQAPAPSSSPSSAAGNRLQEKRLFSLMLDMLCHRLGPHLSPEVAVGLWAALANSLCVQSDLLPLQVHFQVDAALLQLARSFQRPDLMLYGLCCHTMPHRAPHRALAPARLVGEAEDVSKHVLMTLVQLYKAYEMEEVLSWKTFIGDKVKLLQQRAAGQMQAGAMVPPLRLSQLQMRELPDSLLAVIGSIVTGPGNGGGPSNNGEEEPSITFSSGFGCFKLPSSMKAEFDGLIGEVEAQAPPSLNYQVQPTDYWRKLAATPYFYCVLLRIVLEWKSVSPKVAGYADQLKLRTSDACLRTLCDYVVANAALHIGQLYDDCHVQSTDKIMEALETFLLRLNLVPLDRFLVFLLNRGYRDDGWRIVFILVNDMFSKWPSVTGAVSLLCDLCPGVVGSPCGLDHWPQVLARLQERLPEGPAGASLLLPHLYGHLVLRLLPVVELVVAALVHMPGAASLMAGFFGVASRLFRFHSYPLYFCYTLIRSQQMWTPETRRFMQMLTQHVLQEHQPSGRYLSAVGWRLLACGSDPADTDYERLTGDLCRDLMARLAVIFASKGETGLPYVNWRQDQSSSGQSHAVYAAVVELMLCGSSPQAVVDWLVRLCHEQRGSPSFRHYVNIFGCLASLLSGYEDKIRIVLNKADMVDGQQLMRIYGALMWSLGKVLYTPEVTRVYIGSFWDQPLHFDSGRKLFELEEKDLMNDLQSLPGNAALRKLNDFIRRARLAKVHAYIISSLRSQMPSLLGKDSKKRDLIANLQRTYDQVSKEYSISIGDFPKIDRMQEVLQDMDFKTFSVLKSRLVEDVDNMLANDVAKLMQMIPQEQADETGTFAQKVRGGAFEVQADNPFGVGASEGVNRGRFDEEWVVGQRRFKYDETFLSLGPKNGRLNGSAAKEHMVKSKLPFNILGKIWKMSDIDQDGFLDADEFALASYLIDLRLAGDEIPSSLPAHLVPPSKRPTAPSDQASAGDEL